MYSLGLLLWYGLSGGALPLEGESPDPQLSRMSGKDSPAPAAAGLRLGEIVKKACAFKASDRYQTPEALRIMLESCLENKYVSGDSGAELFKKEEEELSEAERMMLAIIGFAIGMVVGDGIMFALSSTEDGLSLASPELADEIGYAAAVAVQTIVSGILGMVTFGTTIVYYDDRFGITSATLIHMAISLISVAVVSNLLWWTDRTLAGTAFFMVYILMLYLLIWTSMFISCRMDIRRINESIEKRRSGKE